jgi:hypothetical protein
MKATGILNGTSLDYLVKESEELKNIFASINKKIHYRKDV